MANRVNFVLKNDTKYHTYLEKYMIFKTTPLISGHKLLCRPVAICYRDTLRYTKT